MTTEGQPHVGETLRQGRLKQRLSIAECAKRTHIAVRYLEAIEDERWADLPSESHRLGFLKLYSRFLGISADDMMKRYQQVSATPVAAPTPEMSSSSATSTPEKRRLVNQLQWSPGSITQLIGGGILLLLLSWMIYHALLPHLLEQNPMPWTRRKASPQSRLIVQKAAIANQKISIQALQDCWVRVTSRHELLFEGILPAKASKVWNGQGPFQIKIANVKSLTLFWNDQPFDVLNGAQGSNNDIRIPPQ